MIYVKVVNFIQVKANKEKVKYAQDKTCHLENNILLLNEPNLETYLRLLREIYCHIQQVARFPAWGRPQRLECKWWKMGNQEEMTWFCTYYKGWVHTAKEKQVLRHWRSTILFWKINELTWGITD